MNNRLVTPHGRCRGEFCLLESSQAGQSANDRLAKCQSHWMTGALNDRLGKWSTLQIDKLSTKST